MNDSRDSRGTISYDDEDHDLCLAVEDGSFWFRHRNDCIADLVGRFAYEGTFYDVGGGNGFVARRLLDEGHDVVLVEPGRRGAENATQKRALPRVVCGTLHAARISAGTAGAIGVFDVIEHVPDHASFVTEIADALRPGGMLFLTVPAYEWMWSDADVSAGHYRRYTKASMAAVLAPLFDVAFASYYFGPLLLPIALMRVLPHRLGVRRRASADDEHGTGRDLAVRVMESMLARERSRLRAGRTVAAGASLIMAARRKAPAASPGAPPQDRPARD